MLSELPEYYQENDFKNIFMTIEKDLNDSINKMNIAPFNEELEKLKNIRKKKTNFNFYSRIFNANRNSSKNYKFYQLSKNKYENLF